MYHLAISTSFHTLSHAQTEFDLPLLSMLHITPVSLKVNCGYARTAIRELTPTKTGLHGRYVQSAKRSQEFRQLFDIPTYALQSSIFESDSSHSSTFDKMCDTVLNMFSKKWHPSTARIEYTATFSTAKWKALSDESKSKHTLSNCEACYYEFQHLQETFPVKPVFVPPTLLSLFLNNRAHPKKQKS